MRDLISNSKNPTANQIREGYYDDIVELISNYNLWEELLNYTILKFARNSNRIELLHIPI